MSEQRFKLDSDDENEPSEFFTDYGDFWEDGTPKTYWFDDYEDFEDIVDLLNEQQSTIKKLQDLCGESDYENAKLRIENKQLRKQQQRLYNYFRNYLEDEMSAENFGEMWDNVKEDERWEW